MFQPVVRQTWAPKGQTPIHYSWDRLSAITVSPERWRLGLYFDIYGHNINTDTFESFVRWLRRRIRRGLILVVDRWSVHRSGVRRLQNRFGSKVRAEWLSAYPPGLNPVQQVWSRTKYGDWGNYIPDDVTALADQSVNSLARTAHDQRLLRSFFQHAKPKL